MSTGSARSAGPTSTTGMPARRRPGGAGDDLAGGVVAAHGVDRDREHRAATGAAVSSTSTATRSLYQPQVGHTVCGSLAVPQRGHMLRDGASSFHAPARRLRVFDFDFFFLGTAIVLSGSDERLLQASGADPRPRPSRVRGLAQRTEPAA